MTHFARRAHLHTRTDLEPALTQLQTIATLKPEKPVFACRPHSLRVAIQYFKKHFHARPLYAVKTNPAPEVIATLKQEGVNQFDVASLQEIECISQHHPNAELYFMHPVKSPAAIRTAYFRYGVRHFSLDSEAEFEKILASTQHASDLHCHVRISTPGDFAKIKLGQKFGMAPNEATALLARMRSQVKGLGLAFHVGSQCMDPKAYELAIKTAGSIAKASACQIDYLNVGGGFPSVYPGMHPPALTHYFETIHREFATLKRDYPDLILLAEPGRALVAEAYSMIVRVELRKNNQLYINEGTYGGLFDAGTPGFIFPTRLLRQTQANTLTAFSFFGPTCDSLDYMPGPFYLPDDIEMGDYIEIGQLGAYSKSLASHFNGFRHDDYLYWIDDKPLLSHYD